MITIDARKDTHEYYRNGSIRGAMAKYVIPLKVGEAVEIDCIIDGKGVPVSDFNTIRANVATLCKENDLKARVVIKKTIKITLTKAIQYKECASGENCTSKKNGRLNTADFNIKKDKYGHLRPLHICKACLSTRNKEYHQKQKQKQLEAAAERSDKINLFLMGRFGHEPRTA